MLAEATKNFFREINFRFGHTFTRKPRSDNFFARPLAREGTRDPDCNGLITPVDTLAKRQIVWHSVSVATATS